jgi:hypothetical protein
MKQLIKNYTFNKTTGTVTFTDFASIAAERLLLITNVTSNTLIYQFNDAALGGVVTGNAINLTYDTSAMNDADKLQVIYDVATGDPAYDNGIVLSVGGGIAHDTADSGNPLKVGYKAVDLKATPTAVAANDRTDAFATRGGIPFALSGHPNTLSQSLQVTAADGAQTNVAVVSVSAGTAIVVTKVSVMAENANSVDVSVRIGFGTANTPAADGAGMLLFHPGIAPGSGVVEGTGAGIIGIGASDEDVRVTCSAPTGGSVNIIVTYHTVLIG